jgi:hypothetical protein
MISMADQIETAYTDAIGIDIHHFSLFEEFAPPPPDFDENGHVDTVDFTHFANCASGPAILQTAASCQDADLDHDGDVDQVDFAVFQACWSSSLPADSQCAR